MKIERNAPRPLAETAPPDEELARRAGRGDREAFSALLEIYQPRVHGLAVRLVGESDAGDCAQDAFLKAWKGLPRYGGRSSFSTWLYKIAYNVCRDRLRRRRIEGFWRVFSPGRGKVAEPVDREDPEKRRVAGETAERLAELFSGLSPPQKAALVLRYEEGLSLEETARSLGVSVSSAKTHLYRALRKLKGATEDL